MNGTHLYTHWLSRYSTIWTGPVAIYLQGLELKVPWSWNPSPFVKNYTTFYSWFIQGVNTWYVYLWCFVFELMKGYSTLKSDSFKPLLITLIKCRLCDICGATHSKNKTSPLKPGNKIYLQPLYGWTTSIRV